MYREGGTRQDGGASRRRVNAGRRTAISRLHRGHLLLFCTLGEIGTDLGEDTDAQPDEGY
jgi:hypothetical protein